MPTGRLEPSPEAPPARSNNPRAQQPQQHGGNNNNNYNSNNRGPPAASLRPVLKQQQASAVPQQYREREGQPVKKQKMVRLEGCTGEGQGATEIAQQPFFFFLPSLAEQLVKNK